MSNILRTIKNPTIQRLVRAVEATARAESRAEAFTEIAARATQERKLGLFSVDHFLSDLATLKQTEDKTTKESQQQALTAAAMLQIDEQLQAENVINASVISMAIEHDNIIKSSMDDTGKLNIIIESKNGLTGATSEQFIRQMRTSPEYSFLFAEKDAGGSSQGTATKANPWTKEGFNLTTQGKIYVQNPELAAKLKAEAGA